MSLSATRPRLDLLTQDLLRAWEETRNAWRDAKAQEFESTYLDELRARVDKAGSALDKLAALLSKVRQDCE